ncbi:hypothetical protein [Xylanibacter ruminicola]|nr:hypothetical protein [Xylanibacter ruminicola]SEH62630.1 hypothetical protein SAMN02745192_0443 [Xylanibacter ruminicola]
MKIIGLYGRGKCGKSETLGIFLRSLLHGINISDAEVKFGKDKDMCESVDRHGIVVDICPPGDTDDIVKANIQFVEQNPCDILFTVTRTKGRGRKALDNYAKSINAELVWIKKNYNDDLDAIGQKEANKRLAEKLFGMI